MQQSTENRPRNLATYPGKMPGIEYAYLKLLQCLQTLVIKNRGTWEFHHPVLIIHLKLNHLSHRTWRNWFDHRYYAITFAFYVHIFKMEMPCIPYKGQTWCKVVNIMWILYALIYLLIILLFEIFYPSKCQNTIDFQQLMLPRDI